MKIDPKWDDPKFQVSGDTEWQARFRSLQSWYRENVLQIEAGYDEYELQRGNFLPKSAPSGLNFLSQEIEDFIDEWLPIAQSNDAMVDEDRLRRNMLSSMPLAFNLFVPLRNNFDLATEVFSSLTNGRVSLVTGIDFEFSPGRWNPLYTNDGTAFDVYVSFNDPAGSNGFVGIEVKYHEKLQEDKADRRERYLEIAGNMGCFDETRIDRLHEPPLGQIWRNHLLAGSLKGADRFQDGFFVLLHPKDNLACIQAVGEYKECLTDFETFDAWHLEDFVDEIMQASPSDWIASFVARYLDLDKLAHSDGG